MKWSEFKETVIREIAVRFIGVAYGVLKILDFFSKSQLDDVHMHWIKTPNYLVRIFGDDEFHDSFIAYRRRGFLKKWHGINKKEIPHFLAKDIFNRMSSNKRRQRAVIKAIELKAFW